MIAAGKNRFISLVMIALMIVVFVMPFSFESDAASPKNATGKIKVSAAVLRTGAGVTSKKRAVLKKNKTVTIMKEVFKKDNKTNATNKWYYVKAGSKKGYLRSDLVKVTSYKKVKAYTTDELNYRSGAGTGMKKKGALKKNSQITVVLEAKAKTSPKKWYKIRKGLSYYYVCSNWVSFKKPEPEPEETPANSEEVQKVIDGTCEWAVKIANDNSFHYGACTQHSGSPKAAVNKSKKFCSHHEGCYFCGTNEGRKSKYIVGYDKTYCCNTFVTAAFAHGGGEPAQLNRCKAANSMWVTDYPKSKLFKSLGKPALADLQKGDVLCAGSHVALYIGDGKIAEAGSRDDNVSGSTSWNNSIRVTDLGSSRYSGFKAVYRYIGEAPADDTPAPEPAPQPETAADTAAQTDAAAS